MNAQDARKQRVAAAALAELQEGMVLGIGTGSTVNAFIELLRPWVTRLRGAVSSSEASTRRLEALGIPVLDLNEVEDLALYVDGADEANPALQLIKGGGAALTREKIVAAAARRFVCIADESKLVDTLGRFPLPVEVIPLARAAVAREIAAKHGGRPVWRQDVVTDNGNHILDVHGLRIVDPVTLESELDHIAGVVTSGLFARRPADLMLVSSGDGIQRMVAASRL